MGGFPLGGIKVNLHRKCTFWALKEEPHSWTISTNVTIIAYYYHNFYCGENFKSYPRAYSRNVLLSSHEQGALMGYCNIYIFKSPTIYFSRR